MANLAPSSFFGNPRNRAHVWEEERKLAREPFMDDKPMDGSPPDCSLAKFRQPRLQQCAFDAETLRFAGRINPNPTLQGGTAGLDGGMDGYNWKVYFGDSGPYVLKLFWDDEPPRPPYYFAAQRECQNAALFQMMQAALSPDHAEYGPVLIHSRPTTRKEARANLLAFSDERRQRRRQQDGADSSLLPVTSIPRLRDCFGWLKLPGNHLFRILHEHLYPPKIRLQNLERGIREDKCYTVIIYEFVEEAKNNPEAVQQVLDFLRDAGFAHNDSPRACNWKNGVLVDLSDFVHPGGCGWHLQRREWTADKVLKDEKP